MILKNYTDNYQLATLISTLVDIIIIIAYIKVSSCGAANKLVNVQLCSNCIQQGFVLFLL